MNLMRKGIELKVTDTLLNITTGNTFYEFRIKKQPEQMYRTYYNEEVWIYSSCVPEWSSTENTLFVRGMDTSLDKTKISVEEDDFNKISRVITDFNNAYGKENKSSIY